MVNNTLFPELEKPSMNFNNILVQKVSGTFDSYFSKTIEKPKANVYLFFGDTASGKTFSALSLPSPVYVIDTENRAISTKYYNYKDKEIHIFEPVQLRTEFDSVNNDSFDTYKTIEEINKFIIDFANEVKSGRIKEGTLVIDSVTDIWSFVQDWSMTELSKRFTAKGEKRADPVLMKMQNQFDWGIPNKRHAEMLGILRSLIRYGINIVFTARERDQPDYVKDTKVQTLRDKIRSQKDVLFLADVIVHLKKFVDVGKVRYLAQIHKLEGLAPPTEQIENITFEKLVKLKEEIEKKIEVRF